MGKLKDFFEAAVGFAAGSTIVGLVLGKVKFADVLSTFIGSFKQNVLYFGLSYISSKGSEDTAQRNLGIKRAVTNPVAPRNVIYGKTRVGGTIVQRTVSSKTGSTSQNVLHNVIAVAGHEINNITKVFMDAGKGTVELDLSSDFTSATENSTTVFRCTNSAFVNADNTDAYTSGSLVKLAFEKGDQTAANGYAVAQIPSGNWSTDHKLLGIAYVYINCIYDTEKFTAIPTFSFEVEGKKVFDPADTNQNQNDPSTFTFSTNPALIIRDYLMDSTYGFGAVAGEINDAASGAGFVQARSDCNDSVSITGGSESRFTLNGEFVATEEPQRVLETMLSACAGQLLYNNGKFSLFVGKGRTASGTITDDKILAPLQIQTKASGKDLVNGVKATYVRPDDKYIAGEIKPYKDSTFLTEDTPTGKASTDYENFLDLAFPYTHSTFTAQRLARIALNYERQDQTLSVLVPLDFLSHQVGDIVNLDNDRLGYSGKDFEIIGMSFEFLNDQYLALRLSLKEYSSTIFDFFTYVADPTLPSEPPSGDNTVGTPTGLALTEGIKDAQVRIHTIRATWTNSVDDKIVTTEVAYKKSTDSNFDAADVSYPSNSFTFGAEPATTYNVKVRHISNTGVSSAYTGTVNLTTSGGQVTLTTGTISGITIESGKLYQGTGTFNNSNTGFYIDSSGQFSLKDKLSFNGTTLNISGNLTVENTISANKIVVDGINLDNLISASTQAGSIYLTEFTGIKIATAGATSGYPALLRIQDLQGTNTFTDITQSQTGINIRARANTTKGTITFQGIGSGITPSTYASFDAAGDMAFNNNVTISGNLTVSGTTTTVDTTNTNVKDNNLTLNYSTGDSSSTANGAGLTIQDAVSASTDATILWDSTNDEFDFSHGITLPDDKRLKLGNSSDLEIYHQTSNGNSIIKESGGGILSLQSNGSEISLYDTANSQFLAKFQTGGQAILYNNGVQRLNTSGSGIDVTGVAVVDGLTSSAAITSTSNSNSLGGTTFTSAVSGTSLSLSASITASGNSNSFGNSSFGTISSGAITTTTAGLAPQIQIVDSDNTTGRLQISHNSSTSSITSVGTSGFGTVQIGGSSSGTGSTYCTFTSTGDFQIGTTTVIDASRNLTNIGTISSGAITSSGKVKGSNMEILGASGSSGFMYIFDSDNGTSNTDGFLLQKSGNNAFVYNRESSGSLSLGAGNTSNYLVIDSSGNIDLGSTQILDQSRNLTNIATISSGKIEGITADADGHILKTDSSTASATDVVLQLRNSSADYNLSFRPRLPAGNMHAGVNADDFGIFTSNSKGISIGNNDKSLVVIHPTDGIEFHTNNTNRFNITTAGNFQLLGTTVIDASRNLANIGTISCGVINSTGKHTFNLASGVNGNIIQLARSAGAYAFNIGISSGSVFQINDNDGSTQLLGISHTTGNATFAGTITAGANSGVIKEIGSDLSLVQGAIGLRINDAASAISPTTASVNNDAAVDLGVSNIRFRNLHLSGTISSGHLTVNTSTLKTTDDAIGLFTTDLTVGNNVAQQATATPKRIFFNNDYSNGFTDASLKLYLFNDDTTRAGLTSGPAFDMQYHMSGATSGRHAFYIQNVEKARIDNGGIDIKSGGLDINGTSVINSSRNLTNIGTISSTGDQTTFGNLLLESNAQGFRTVAMNTSDGADNQSLYLCGGATASGARGAMVAVFGNEFTTYGGEVNLIAGRVSTGNIIFKTGTTTTERMRLDSSGRVGIGTTSPAHKLHIASGATNVGIQTISTDAGAYMGFEDNTTGNTGSNSNVFIGANGDNFVVFTGASERVRINSTGLGIGTTSPSSTLDVRGITTIQTDGGNEQLVIKRASNTNEQLILGFHSSDYGSIQAVEQGVSFRPLVLQPSGANVGIGTTNPAEKLHVVGQASFENAGNVNRGNIILGPHGNGTAKWATLAGTHFNDETGSGNGSGAAGCMIIGLNTSSGGNEVYVGGGPYELNPATAIRFYTHGTNLHNLGGSERMRLDSSGRLGLGTTSPASEFHLSSTAPVITATATNTNSGLRLNVIGGGNEVFRIQDNGTERFQIDSSGNTTVTGTELRLGSSSVISRIRTINASGFTETAFDNFSSGAYQERMRISSSGSVGIAKTNPSSSYKLDVNGKIRSQQEILINTGSLFINEEGEGIHILSANGTEYKLTVSNAGALVITEQ